MYPGRKDESSLTVNRLDFVRFVIVWVGWVFGLGDGVSIVGGAGLVFWGNKKGMLIRNWPDLKNQFGFESLDGMV